MKKRLFPVFAFILFVAFPVLADDTHHMNRGSKKAPVNVYDGAMMNMHKGMTKMSVTGDVDVDFVQSMIPHHQGAVNMAKIQLKYGKDPAIRKLAKDIIISQEKEIAMMKAWLENKGKK